MPYLLDTNTLIQAKNEYYGFDICPGYWNWIEAATLLGDVHSIAPVLQELRDGEDELTAWANKVEKASKFFLPMDQKAVSKIANVVEWVQNRDFKEQAKRDFLARADPQLIAYALAHKDVTIVTHEVHVEGEKKKVKIPTVCRALGIRCERTFTMLSREKIQFDLTWL